MATHEQLSAKDATDSAERAAAMLAADKRVQLVYLFGSAADPDRSHVRDVDIAVLAEPAFSLDEMMRVRADIVLSTGVQVDLVSLNDVPVVLGWEIADSGRCLFARTPDLDTEFVVRARARFFDFKPFLDEQWRLTDERLKERERGS